MIFSLRRVCRCDASERACCMTIGVDRMTSSRFPGHSVPRSDTLAGVRQASVCDRLLSARRGLTCIDQNLRWSPFVIRVRLGRNGQFEVPELNDQVDERLYRRLGTLANRSQPANLPSDHERLRSSQIHPCLSVSHYLSATGAYQ